MDTTGVLEAQLMGIKSSLVDTASYVFYLAGYERVLTIIFHTAMSLLVCYFVYKKKALLGVGIAFLAHFLVDFIAPIISGMATPYLGNAVVISLETSYAIVYSFLTLVAIASVIVIIMIGKKWKAEAGLTESGR